MQFGFKRHRQTHNGHGGVSWNSEYLDLLAVLVPRDVRSRVGQHALEYQVLLAFHGRRLRQLLREEVLHFLAYEITTISLALDDSEIKLKWPRNTSYAMFFHKQLFPNLCFIYRKN